MNQLLGPLLLVTGLILMFAERIPVPRGGDRRAEPLRRWVEKGGLWAAAPVGFVFALSLCPVSAALFFGSLIPLSVQHSSFVLFPILFGLGTAIPAVGIAVALGLGGGAVGRAYNRVSSLERWARRVTAVLFVLVGVFLTAKYHF